MAWIAWGRKPLFLPDNRRQLIPAGRVIPETALFSMIIACPVCASRFKIDADRIPAAGRPVRCGKCGHVWRVAADGEPIQAAPDDLPAPEPADTDDPARLSVGDSAPAPDETPDEDTASPHAGNPGGDEVPGQALESPAPAPRHPDDVNQNSETGIGNAGTTDQADRPAGPAPSMLATGLTPHARQKLQEARKGRSRVRFLLIALVLMIVVVVAVSFIKRPDGLNPALWKVPPLNEGSAGDSGAGENAGGPAQQD